MTNSTHSSARPAPVNTFLGQYGKVSRWKSMKQEEGYLGDSWAKDKATAACEDIWTIALLIYALANEGAALYGIRAT